MKWICALVLLCSLKSFAQYPFDKYPAIKYRKLPVKGGFISVDSSYQATAKYGVYSLTIRQKFSHSDASLTVYKRSKIISRFKMDDYDQPLTLIDTIYAADFNGDGLTDFKISIWNDGSGLAGSLLHKLYFFNSTRGFKFYKYCDFYDGPERDFNGDGEYEIIGKVYDLHKGHAYWTFNIFDYVSGEIVNVNNIANYPIMVQFLYRENFAITTNLSRKNMKIFSLKKPDYFKYRNR